MEQQEKSLYASYLNMATCNVNAIMHHIEAVFEPTTKKDIIPNVDDGFKNIEKLKIFTELNSGTDNVKKEKIFAQIQKFMPFFKQLFELNPNDEKKAMLCEYVKLLFDLRNYYTHVCHNAITIPNIETKLNLLFDANIRTIKERFDLEEQALTHLRRKIDRYENKNFQYKFFANNGFTEKGLLFFICQFLEKKYAFLMLKQHKGFKDSRQNWKKATLNTFCVQCLNLPRTRLDSTETKITLGMDIANEIYKCPKELFDLLSKKNKEKFRVKIDEAEKQDADNEILKKRFGDRFPYFALRYLDTKNCLPNIYFHIDMGNYFFEKYKKTLIDGTRIDDRRLSKRILCFDKMEAAQQKFLNEKEKGLYAAKTEGQNEYQNDTFPHYHINNNQVGIKLKSFYPKLQQKDTKSESPDAWLSIYELPLIVYLCLKGNSANIENIIKTYVDGSKKFFTSVKENKDFPTDEKEFKTQFGIQYSDIPEIFRKPQKNYAELAKTYLTETIAQTERLLTNFKNEQNYTFKAGKKAQPRFKSGHIADLLVEDFLRFQPSDLSQNGKDKITAPNYQALQVALAYYGRDKDKLPEIFKNAGLTEGNNQHPFLKNCLPLPKKAGDFFKSYLQKKIAYLKNLETDPQKMKSAYFLRQYYKKASLDLQTARQKMASELLTLPINLPRGLFADLFDKDKDKDKDNPSRIIFKELNETNNDNVQDFYSFPRHYEILKTLGLTYGKLPKISKIKNKIKTDKLQIPIDNRTKRPKYTEQEYRKIVTRQVNDFEQNEKLLRYRKTCDIVSFSMVKDLLEMNKPEIKMSLTNDDNNFILDQMQELSISIETGGKKFTISGNMKIKNIGNFRRILFDKRLKTFCKYFDDNSIFDYETIEKEFETYDIARKEIFEKIHKFEGAMIEKNKLQNTNGYIPFNKVTSDVKLIEIRNAFSHHEYTDATKLNLQLDLSKEITTQIVDFCKNIFEEETQKIS